MAGGSPSWLSLECEKFGFFLIALGAILVSNVNLHRRLAEAEVQRADRHYFRHSTSHGRSQLPDPPGGTPEKAASGASTRVRHPELSESQRKIGTASAPPSDAMVSASASGSGEGSERTCEIQLSTDFFGFDLAGTSAEDAADCCAQCRRHSSCGAFSFVIAEKSCWLKRSEASLHPSVKQGVASGVLPMRLPPPRAPAPESLADPSLLDPSAAIPVLVIAYNRADYLRRTLESILNAVPQKQAKAFELIISQQGSHSGVTGVIRQFKAEGRIKHHLKFKYKDDGKRQKGYEAASWINYYKMTQHYGFAIGEAFRLDPQRYNHLIVMEDDIDVAPDFFEYFTLASRLLDSDPSLYCASAWNDNGMTQFVRDPKALRRTDVFPGLGWMLTRKLWAEIASDGSWPLAFWDEAMREPPIRKGRSCLIPAVNRAYTFGSSGNSQTGGFWWKKFLEPIRLAESPEPWTEKFGLTQGGKAAYDASLRAALLGAEEHSIDDAVRFEADVGSGGQGKDWLVLYKNEKDYISKAGKIGLLNEYKEGRPRASYCGVTVFWAICGHRVYLTHETTLAWARGSEAECDGGSALA